MHSMRSRFIENCPGEADSKEDENNMNDTNLTIRPMTIDDFEQVHSLWMEIHGFGIRSVDDSKEGVERFIRRNPATSMVAVSDGKIVAFKQNEIGNRFWQSLGWKYCDNVNYYEYVLNEENITVFNP